MRDYNTVLKTESDEIIIEKSRFIGSSFPVENVNEADEIIKVTKKKYYDATHNCYAYIIGEDMSLKKANDDGEPSSTAGVPILKVMENLNVTNTLIIVTRYFGGIKLGASGLIRAYTKGAKAALSANKIVSKKVYRSIELDVDYSVVGKIQKYLDNGNIIYKSPQFLEYVKFNLYEIEQKIDDLKKDLLDITNANCKLDIKNEVYLDFVDGKYLKK